MWGIKKQNLVQWWVQTTRWDVLPLTTDSYGSRDKSLLHKKKAGKAFIIRYVVSQDEWDLNKCTIIFIIACELI